VRRRGQSSGPSGSQRDLGGSETKTGQLFDQRRSCWGRSWYREQTSAEHGLGDPDFGGAQGVDTAKHGARPQTKSIREPLGFEQKVWEAGVSAQSGQSRPGRLFDPGEEARVSKESGARDCGPGDNDEDGARRGVVGDAPPGRNSRMLPEFHSPAENRRDSAQSPSAVEVREMSGFDGGLSRNPCYRSNGKGGGQGARRAHAETLTDR
jgi:hypothetical protein